MLRDLCLACQKSVTPQDRYCNHCGVDRGAPQCPHCGQPVTHSLDRLNGLDHYTWNSHWNAQCVSCGFNFSAKLQLETGHTTTFTDIEPEWGKKEFPYTGKSQLEISPQESIYMACDAWEYLPTIEVRIQRAVAANAGNTDNGGLSQQECIVLTVEELQAIFEQLQGPLQVLMQRKQWTQDTT